MYTLLKQRRLRWLGHVVRMADVRIPKDLLYGELVQGNRPRGRPQLRYKDLYKQDLKALGMDLNRWETLTSEHSAWRQAVHHGLSQFEDPLSSRLRQRGSPKTSKISELDKGQIVWKGLLLLNWPSQPH